MNLNNFDGAPCAVKAARTVLGGGKSGDDFKGLPIAIRRKVAGRKTACRGRRCCADRYHPHPPALRSARLIPDEPSHKSYMVYVPTGMYTGKG